MNHVLKQNWNLRNLFPSLLLIKLNYKNNLQQINNHDLLKTILAYQWDMLNG